MTQLAPLSTKEQRQFDAPPRFTDNERVKYFALDSDTRSILHALRSVTNKIGFVLQLGYFKSHGKFYTAQQFRDKDIRYASKLLNIDVQKINWVIYQKTTPANHRKKILAHLGWQPLTEQQLKNISTVIAQHVQEQSLPRKVFLFIIDYCWQQQIELPSYHKLAELITGAYQQYEVALISHIKNSIRKRDKEILDNLVTTDKHQNNAYKKPSITELKKICQSLRPSQIQKNVIAFEVFKNHFEQLEPLISKLKLSDQSTEYFSIWVEKAKASQLKSFTNPNKLYLHLLSYIKHQYCFRQDILIDCFLKSVQTALNAVDKALDAKEKLTRAERNKAIKGVTQSNKNSRLLIEEITDVVRSSSLSEHKKLSDIASMLEKYHQENDEAKKKRILNLEELLTKLEKGQAYYELLALQSSRLQNRVEKIARLLNIHKSSSDAQLVEALDYLKHQPIQNDAPTDFLAENEKRHLYHDGNIQPELYKIMLFTHMAKAIKAGTLNLNHTYRYKPIHEYLVSESLWKTDKERLLKESDLLKCQNFNSVIDNLKTSLHQKYEQVNQGILSGENPHLNIDENIIRLNTPKVEKQHCAYTSLLLGQAGHVPILEILHTVDQVAHFSQCFKHHSVKHHKIKLTPDIVYAGLLGKGCNIGLGKMANISIGITDDILKNAVHWCFSLKNISSANSKLQSIINKLALANSFKKEPASLHTGSDGRKVTTAVDSLHANYSFKYFGKDKGVTMYTFLDERHILFHSTVISASEREAAYVIDGLLQNDVIKSDIHSTDTHGFTETIFAAMNFMGTAFAPRFKQLNTQTLYGFKSRSYYEKKNYKLVPSRPINQKLIRDQWDTILRFMVSIKLKFVTASQLFKRLSSYAKDHPLYKALKEFGRIIKSAYILSYYDDVQLRQRIEKQLNKVELSNKFAKAVFFANNGEFHQGELDNQKISTACMTLIQNAIVLWNYLYVSQQLIKQKTKEREKMLQTIQQGSMMIWHHINLQGEYDFTKLPANDVAFNMAKIYALKLG